MWRTALVRVGSQEKPKYEPRDWPCRCEECPEPQRARYGCGWDESLRGKGTPVHPDDKSEHFETCPQWLARQPAVCSVYELLGDYKDGRLGDSRDLPRALLECLRAAAAELETWQRVQSARVTDGS